MEYAVDIIIPLYGKWKEIEKLVSVLSEDKENNLIIVNDGYRNSGEKPEDMENIHYYYKKNGGFASAVNYGVRKGGAPLLFIVNTDIKISKDVIGKLKECIKDKDAVMPIIYSPKGKIESLGIKRITGNMWIMAKRKGEKIDALPFTAIMIKRAKWGKGLCEDYFMYYEDIDFFYNKRIKKGICENAKITHFHSQSVKHKYYFLHRARWIFWIKHSRGLPVYYFFFYFLWDILSIVRAFFKGYFIDAIDARIGIYEKHKH